MKLKLEHLSKRWGDVIGADNVNLEINDGEFVAFLGPSGCGKTTTLLMIAGIYKATNGLIKFDERVVNKLPPKDRNIGILSLYTATRREFSPEEIEFLCALAEQGGLAIENNRLHRRMQRNAMLFLDLASSINSSLDINQILNYMTVNISEKLGMKGAVLRLLDDERNELKLVASHGLSDEFLKRVRTTSTETSRRALNGETLVVSDSTTDASITHRKSMKDEGVVAMIVTPLMARDKVIGVLRLYSDVPREFPEDVILMVKALAHQGGLAIQNASMYLQLQADKKSLEEDIWSYRSWF